ncbi:ADP-ribosylation_factor 1 [Hexamita inflata]|uniref:ADP-ribosylation factor 1 n=1 Tax=Hexamita inflata TaxID=28002 RepID=A0AA86TVQ2_9EUKA|nr:ADP-ribosylation factor 1 [Hexamita inflata]
MLGMRDSGCKTLFQHLNPKKKQECVPNNTLFDNIIIKRNITITRISLCKAQLNIQAYKKLFQKPQTHIIFVIDSTNIQSELRKQIDQIINIMPQQNTKLLLFLTKIDLQGSKTNEEIIDELNLDSLKLQTILQRCNALTGEGIQQGLDWLKKK